MHMCVGLCTELNGWVPYLNSTPFKYFDFGRDRNVEESVFFVVHEYIHQVCGVVILLHLHMNMPQVH